MNINFARILISKEEIDTKIINKNLYKNILRKYNQKMLINIFFETLKPSVEHPNLYASIFSVVILYRQFFHLKN